MAQRRGFDVIEHRQLGGDRCIRAREWQRGAPRGPGDKAGLGYSLTGVCGGALAGRLSAVYGAAAADADCWYLIGCGLARRLVRPRGPLAGRLSARLQRASVTAGRSLTGRDAADGCSRCVARRGRSRASLPELGSARPAAWASARRGRCWTPGRTGPAPSRWTRRIAAGAGLRVAGRAAEVPPARGRVARRGRRCRGVLETPRPIANRSSPVPSSRAHRDHPRWQGTRPGGPRLHPRAPQPACRPRPRRGPGERARRAPLAPGQAMAAGHPPGPVDEAPAATQRRLRQRRHTRCSPGRFATEKTERGEAGYHPVSPYLQECCVALRDPDERGSA